MIDKNGSERRQHARYGLRGQVFIAIRPQFDRLGWALDISEDGVSLEYPILQDYSALSEEVNIDIFSTPRKIDLSNLPCQLVYDTPIQRENGFFRNIGTRRCGLVFVNLSVHQAAQLKIILREFTTCCNIEKADSPEVNLH
ncbi:MAG: PilZ domain-containing protein [Deltaproteobacteria bacterium]|nr:PilZ domain-containing protein [Deltaproteobacteria bacterium]